MSRALLSLIVILMAICPVHAHPMPETIVVLDVNQSSINAQLSLPLIELKLGWREDLSDDPTIVAETQSAELSAYVLEHVRPVAPDGRPWLVRVTDVAPVDAVYPEVTVSLHLTPPSGAPVDQLTLHYDVIFHQLVTHKAIITLGRDWRSGKIEGDAEVLGVLRDVRPSLEIDRSESGSWARGMHAVFNLGASHIAEGTDHLLFLIALLLPAPLCLERRRWGEYCGTRRALRRILGIVTAFTLGHSVTLALGACGLVQLPERLVESLVAASILVSAVHAIRPIVGHREWMLAAGFGLVHGLAFGGTLVGFGFDLSTIVASMLAFNLGIEAVQMIVVLVALPWLLLLARSSSRYTRVRVLASIGVAIAAVGWCVEQATGGANPISTWIADTAPLTWSTFALVAVPTALAASVLALSRRRRSPHTALACT